jgi:hypothetical protein
LPYSFKLVAVYWQPPIHTVPAYLVTVFEFDPEVIKKLIVQICIGPPCAEEDWRFISYYCNVRVVSLLLQPNVFRHETSIIINYAFVNGYSQLIFIAGMAVN